MSDAAGIFPPCLGIDFYFPFQPSVEENAQGSASARRHRKPRNFGQTKVFVSNFHSRRQTRKKTFAVSVRDHRNARKGRVAAVRHFSVRQIAADCRGIFSVARQRAAVQPAGSDFNLRNRTVGGNFNRFGASLPAVIAAVRLAVIKNVPLPARLLDTAVRGGGMV